MSIAANVGSQALLQLGVSLSDIALMYSHGRKIGNWLRARRNDEDLFESLMEDSEVLLRRQGFVDPHRIEAKFPDTAFIYQGGKVSSMGKRIQGGMASELKPFSWLMVIVVTALDICLPRDRLVEVLIDAFVRVLENENAAASLRVSLDVNVESWRSVGQVRGMVSPLRLAFQKVWLEKTGSDAIAQLNPHEELEATKFLQDLLSGKTNDFLCFSASTVAVAKSIQYGGIDIKTCEKRVYETQFRVDYATELPPSEYKLPDHHPTEYEDPLRLQRGLQNRAQMISYPAEKPESMIHAIQASRETLNWMKVFWEQGAKSAHDLSLVAQADLPYNSMANKEVYYQLADVKDSHADSFATDTLLLATKALPCTSQSILSAFEMLTEGLDAHRKEWLEMHSGLEYLLRGDSDITSGREENMSLWLKYQALVFGFYYGLLGTLVTRDFVCEKEPFFRGLWGYGSTTFLAMCTEFGRELRRSNRVGRTHVMYMLATMYGGRPKMFKPDSSRLNLLGVLGPVSVVALTLLRSSDEPEQLARFAVLDLPIVHLVPEADGELYGSSSWSIMFRPPLHQAQEVRPHGSTSRWSVHSSMAGVFPQSTPGVVMAARCEGRLVGWFSPMAADTLFLSTAYMRREGQGEETEDYSQLPVKAFEVLDDDWQQGIVPRPMPVENQDSSFGVVHSTGCAALRYAAAGFYGCAGEEVVIANGDVLAAFGRIELQESGVIIS